MGISSITNGIESFSIFIDFKLLLFTKTSPINSPLISWAFVVSISAPIFFKISMKWTLVLFKQTFFMLSSEFLFNRAATIKKAADEGSPGISKDSISILGSGWIMISSFSMFVPVVSVSRKMAIFFSLPSSSLYELCCLPLLLHNHHLRPCRHTYYNLMLVSKDHFSFRVLSWS